MYTRSELEDFMNNKPHGAFKRELKARKGTKEYKFRLTPCQHVYGTPQEVTVRAKNRDEAFSQAKIMVQKTLDYKPHSWRSQIIG